ncbi:unnamed protein product [Lymnaea stagnalis]|uniref:Uncharacterized protein n=1 Tax=Lymnaea stagnalis TaxID=6523 RepID=A0AAV2HW38_LYMST
MGKKKGRIGQKKVQGPKAKAAQKAKKVKIAKTKAKNRKTQNKAIKSNLKKMTFDNTKKIDLLNADITKVLLAPAKLKVPSAGHSSQNAADADLEMPDVEPVAQKLDQAAIST